MHPAALVWTGVASHKTKTVESDDLCRNPHWSSAVVNLAHINPTEALSIEIIQQQDVFYEKTVARFMVDLSGLESCVENDLQLEAVGGYMTVEQERTYRKAKELFDGIDKDGNGLLDKSEVKTLFESMNLEVTDEQHEKAYREMDDDGNGEVDFDEFHEWYANHQHSIEKIWKPRVNAVFTIQDALDGAEPWIAVDLKLPAWVVPKRPQSAKKMTVEEERDEALGLFKEIDLDDSGALDASEIKHLLQAMGVKLSDKDVTEAFKAMGIAGKQEVDFESFFLWWQANQSRAAGMKSKLMNKMKLRLRNSQSPAGSRPSTVLQTPSSPPAKGSEELKQFFESIDTNGNGLLDREEVRELSRSLGSELTEDKLTEAMDSMDPQTRGVDFEQFSQWYTKLDHNLNSGGSFGIRRGFRSFASNTHSLGFMNDMSPYSLRSDVRTASQKTSSPTRVFVDPAVKMRLDTAHIEMQDAAATKAKRSKLGSAAKAQQIEAELGLTGSPEEAARIAKMQASVRGKQDRKKVASLRARSSLELGLAVVADAQTSSASASQSVFSALSTVEVAVAIEEHSEHLPMGWELHYPEEQ